MTTAVYQATVEELEALLSPRVVSRSLQEGLNLVGKTPQTVAFEDLEEILKAQVYRQLQVALPATEAKARIQDILERVKVLSDEAAKQTAVDQLVSQQAEVLLDLKAKLKPYNLYFEWSEVQKLRALIQLLEVEQEEGREAPKLITDALEQLKVVEQKLEDQLVLQAKELAELEATFESVQALGGAKVRRLENLISQIRESQHSRQLATAEVERSRKLSLDLRKLMESSVMVDIADDSEGLLNVESEADELLSIDTEGLAPEVTEKLLALDVENERHQLASYTKSYKNLLAYRPDLESRFSDLKNKLDSRTSVAEELPKLEQSLKAAQTMELAGLKQELNAILAALDTMPAVDSEELRQAVQIAFGMSETALPSLEDMQHIRSLYTLAQNRQKELAEQKEADQAAVERRQSQEESLQASLADSLEKYKDRATFKTEYEAFASAYQKLDGSDDAWERDEALETALAQEAKLLDAIMERSGDEQERSSAELKGYLRDLQKLPLSPAMAPDAGSLQENLKQHLRSESVDSGFIAEVAQRLASLKAQVEENFTLELTKLEQTAESSSAHAFKRTLESARAALQDGIYPDLEALSLELSESLEQRRTEQLNDLRMLETEIKQYQGMSTSTINEVSRFIDDARQSLERGEIVGDFNPAWLLLEQLRQDAEQRSSNFIPRLDAALADYRMVAKLNTDEVEAVGRTLNHLDSQRDALDKISENLRGHLEAALSDAEDSLVSLKEQFEATKAIAGQLVDSSSVLDDLFGAFDTPSKETT